MAHHSPTRTNGEKGFTWSGWSKKEQETPFSFVFEFAVADVDILCNKHTTPPSGKLKDNVE